MYRPNEKVPKPYPNKCRKPSPDYTAIAGPVIGPAPAIEAKW